MNDERFEVRHLPEQSRYALIDRGEDGTGDQEIGEEQYLDLAAGTGDGDGARPVRIMYHTLVSEDYAGRGLASRLVRPVVDDAIAAGLAIVPVCPYVAAWLPKHPEYSEHVIKPTADHLKALGPRPR